MTINTWVGWHCQLLTGCQSSVDWDVPRVSNINLLLTEREGRTGKYWPSVVFVRTLIVFVRTLLRSVRTKTTEGQYSPVRLELARLVSSLLYGTRSMLVLMLLAFENKKYTAYDRFHENGPYGEIPTKKEPIRTLGFTLPYNNIYYYMARQIRVFWLVLSWSGFCHADGHKLCIFWPRANIPQCGPRARLVRG